MPEERGSRGTVPVFSDLIAIMVEGSLPLREAGSLPVTIGLHAQTHRTQPRWVHGPASARARLQRCLYKASAESIRTPRPLCWVSRIDDLPSVAATNKATCLGSNCLSSLSRFQCVARRRSSILLRTAYRTRLLTAFLKIQVAGPRNVDGQAQRLCRTRSFNCS